MPATFAFMLASISLRQGLYQLICVSITTRKFLQRRFTASPDALIGHGPREGAGRRWLLGEAWTSDASDAQQWLKSLSMTDSRATKGWSSVHSRTVSVDAPLVK
jgi:hypothetical protein